MKHKSRFIFLFSLLLILLSAGCSNDPQPATTTNIIKETQKPLSSVNIAINSTIKSASIILAQELGFFKDQGLQVKLQVKKTGVATHKALLDGEADLATVPEILAAYDTLKHDNWQIITSVNRSDTNLLIGRKDHGVNSIASLQGKKVGIKLKSGSIYWLNRMLTYNSLFQDDISLVDGQPDELVQMIKNSKIDAVITWQPHAHKIEKELGEKAFSYAVQQNQDMYWVLLAQRNWILQNQETSTAIIKALQSSAQYITTNTHEAKKIIAKYLQLDSEYVDFEWPLHHFANELPQNLLLTMEEELQWKIGRQKEPQPKPDLSSYIYPDALSSIDRNAVGIVR